MGLEDLKRVTDLFVEGEIVVLDQTDPPTTLWVNKLNGFEREEAQRDGQAARSRAILAMKDLESPDYLMFQAAMSEMSDEDIRSTMLAMQENEFFLQVVDAIRQDPEWRDRMEARTRVGVDMDEAEHAAVAKINEDYQVEMQTRLDYRRSAYVAQLAADFDSARLKEEYRKEWLQARSYGHFQRDYAMTMLFYSVRVCKAKLIDGAWNHDDCESHRRRALDHRVEVKLLPDGLLNVLNRAAASVQVTGRDARFSGALVSSSGSSARPSEPEASTASTPEATPSEPVTISS